MSQADDIAKRRIDLDMRKLEAYVNPDAEEFYLAYNNGWTKMIGHAITIDEYQFSVVPILDILLVSEVTSGAKVFELSAPVEIESYEEVMLFLETVVVATLINTIEHCNKKDPKFLNNLILDMRKKVFEKHGEMPKGEKVNIDFFKADLSRILH